MGSREEQTDGEIVTFSFVSREESASSFTFAHPSRFQAVSYFTLSADLGDQDAQQDVAFCYANGKGVKKDLKKAAHYYRLAIAQGAEDWGLSWIYKPKYMDT